MRLIGPHRARSEFEPDPVLAYRRGRVLDAMLRSALPAEPRGVTRATFARSARAQAERALAAARRLNRA